MRICCGTFIDDPGFDSKVWFANSAPLAALSQRIAVLERLEVTSFINEAERPASGSKEAGGTFGKKISKRRREELRHTSAVPRGCV